MSAANRKKVVGSEKKAPANAQIVGEVDPKKQIEITVMVRPRSNGSSQAKAYAAMAMSSQLPENRQYMSRENFTEQRGADPDDLAKVEAFAHQHNLEVIESSVPKRTVRLSGSVADLTAAFKPNLKKYKMGRRVFRGRTGGISVPDELSKVVVGVFGFDNRPTATPHSRLYMEAASNRGAKLEIAPRSAVDCSFYPPQVAQLYNFPANLDGSGQCIAIIELNDIDQHNKVTGTGYSLKDLKAYFKSLKIPMPKVTAVSVDGGANMPGPDSGSDGEVMLDIEVAGAVAPGASIVVYFAPNTDSGFMDAISSALHDTKNKPSVISISWGGPEDSWTQQAINAYDQILQDASALGVTVCCSAGDDGSSDVRDPQERNGKPRVDFPAASSFALACGGTELYGSGTTISSEAVWNEGTGATGGGVSNFFSRPAYQAKAKVPRSPAGKLGRGVPDVAGDADPKTGYKIRLVGGQQAVIGGTSAVSPLWAGLIALVNQRLSSLGKPSAGFLNPLIYKMPSTEGAFHDIVQGNNDIEGLGKYKARKNWDACTGLGTPDGTKLLTSLGG
jgi:kumamolisin